MRFKGIQQNSLTKHLGVSKSVFTQWKSGKSKSYNKYIVRIASYLSVSVEELVRIDNNERRTP
jgi:ribosome-binding protein aMBF1 (putative translation factor)